MEGWKAIASILLASIFIDNFVLSKFLGICSFLGVSNKTSSALGMSGSVVFVMTLSAAVTWPIYRYVLYPNDLGYLKNRDLHPRDRGARTVRRIVLSAFCRFCTPRSASICR